MNTLTRNDILNRIEQLRKERGWSRYRLTSESDLSASVLNNLFSRGNMPNLETLTKLCDAFQISLSQFFNEDDSQVMLTDDEQKLLQDYRKLNKKDKRLIAMIIGELNQ